MPRYTTTARPRARSKKQQAKYDRQHHIGRLQLAATIVRQDRTVWLLAAGRL